MIDEEAGSIWSVGRNHGAESAGVEIPPDSAWKRRRSIRYLKSDRRNEGLAMLVRASEQWDFICWRLGSGMMKFRVEARLEPS